MASTAPPEITKRMTLRSKDANPAAPAPPRMSSRVTRKVQPGIKDRAESFLANAAANLDPVPNSRTTSSPGLKSRKRKLVDLEKDGDSKSASTLKGRRKVVAEEHDDGFDVGDTNTASSTKGKKQAPVAEDGDVGQGSIKKYKTDGEKRLRQFRKHAPKTFLEKLERAQTQRMIVIGRTRSDTEAFPREEIDIVGSTGNIYRVTIGQSASCTCPDSKKGNECKHKVYALHTVLKAPERLQYQLAFLSSELREIFANAPPIPTETSSSTDTDGHRKEVEGECPICYMDFDEDSNELVWCKAACGNNMHKSCFDQWAASQRGATVKCVYCRTPWQVHPGDIKNLTKAGSVGEDGYVNVAEQFGMSAARDYSSYHQPWVRRRFGYY